MFDMDGHPLRSVAERYAHGAWSAADSWILFRRMISNPMTVHRYDWAIRHVVQNFGYAGTVACSLSNLCSVNRDLVRCLVLKLCQKIRLYGNL